MNNLNIGEKPVTHIIPLRDNIVRVTHSFGQTPPPTSPLISEDFVSEPASPSFCEQLQNGELAFRLNGEPAFCELKHDLVSKNVYKYIVDGEPQIRVKQTANGEVAYIENAQKEPCGTAFEGRLIFRVNPGERLYGLGQHEDGVYNYNGQTQYLYQTNMKISLPFLLSSRNYGIFIDTETAIVYRSEEGKVTFTLDTVDYLSYYVITGNSFDEIIGALRELTGAVPMLPRWAFGYIQSKEHYRSSGELLEIAGRFRKSGIPLDCIVQDWATWAPGQWGEKCPDKLRYPDLPGMLEALHKDNIRLMVSIWPNMAPECENYAEFAEKGMLLPNAPVYDAFDENARRVYWNQCEKEWFSSGTDAWWCDNAEPFSDADWNGAEKRPEALRCELVLEESRKSMDWRRLNTYGLFHAKGIYDNWRNGKSPKRVVNLTRSAYISGQRYGVIAWSGDISASWSTLKKQITEGIQFSLCGLPYWTFDIGAFFTVKDKWENRGCGKAGDPTPLWFWNGDYNDGVNDLGYRELYVRWFQMGAFLPIFRSHGTDTPREPWNFGEKGEPFYDALLKFIHLRYRLLPYIYSCAAAVTLKNETMMRSLMFDFSNDENCLDIKDSFLLGRFLLVCPITEPMYYGPDSVKIEGASKTKEVYLPKGFKWIDFWSNRVYEGGQRVVCEAPLDIIPIFVRAGAILPMSEQQSYADEHGGKISELMIYAGADGSFTLYNDEGDNYSYEKGNYSVIPLTYNDAAKELTVGEVQGEYQYQKDFTVNLVSQCGIVNKTVKYNGSQMTVKLF